jgi:hypothetical protein
MTHSRARLFNTLTLVFLGLTGLVTLWYVVIFIAPTALNPFPPIGVASAPTDTPTATPPRTLTPTSTVRPTNTPTSTPTPSPTLTATPAITRTLTGRETPTPSATSGPSPTATWTQSPFNYVAEVQYSRSNYGLNWAGIAGLVIGIDGVQQTNILVRAWGGPPLGAEGTQTTSGLAPQYGVSGFEFTLGDRPVTGRWNVQLVADDGNPLSDAIEVVLESDPRANLAFVIFEQNH